MAGLLAKSGKDSINIAGHKVPIALLAGGIALLGVIVVLRARQNQGQVAAIGAAPATAADTGFGLGAPIDYGPAIANLSQQLTSLGQSINATPAPAPAPAPAAPTPSAPGGLQSLITGPISGTDTGFYFGATPSSIPAGDSLVWRYTSQFLAGNPQFGSGIARGAGPPNGQPAPAYSWEWAVVPASQAPGING